MASARDDRSEGVVGKYGGRRDEQKEELPREGQTAVGMLRRDAIGRVLNAFASNTGLSFEQGGFSDGLTGVHDCECD